MNETTHRGINHSVREFATAAANADEDTIAALLGTMLREIGETLSIDACAFVDLTSSPESTSTFMWCRPIMSASGLPFEAQALGSLFEQVRDSRRTLIIQSDADTAPDDVLLADVRAYLRHTMIRTAAIIPTGLGDTSTWGWVLGSMREATVWGESLIEHLQVLGAVVAGSLSRRLELQPEAERDEAPPRVAVKRRSRSSAEASGSPNAGFEEIIGNSRALQAAVARLWEVVNSESSVVLLGETGTGKELFARALHTHGPRRDFPLVSVNCAALPPTLIESELFGHQRGAFTGAIAPRQGRFELAHHGSLFLDEIGDLPLDLQPKLLRVLQEGEFERVGSSQTQTVDVRIIAATHKDLGLAVAEEEFRADLYYRLNVFPIRVPPLRERLEDIRLLVWAIIRKRQRALQRHITAVPNEVFDRLQRYSWPGNIRELENVVERALIHTTGETLTLLEESLEEQTTTHEPRTTLMSVERAHIEEVLHDCRWRINGIGNAAERLGLHPNTLRFRMKKLGIVRRESVRDPRRLHPDSGSHASERAS